MKPFGLLAFTVWLVAGCCSAAKTQGLPFRHSAFVTRYTIGELSALVADQYRRLHDQASHEFKRYPSPKELTELEVNMRSGDLLVEYENKDYWVRENGMSQEAARAFCVIRMGRVERFVKIWELGGVDDSSMIPNQSPDPTLASGTSPAGQGPRLP